MNISYDHIKKIEMGIRACSLDLLVEFSTYFDVSADNLLTGRDYENIHAKKRLEAVLGELTESSEIFNLNSLQMKLKRLK